MLPRCRFCYEEVEAEVEVAIKLNNASRSRQEW